MHTRAIRDFRGQESMLSEKSRLKISYRDIAWDTNSSYFKMEEILQEFY